MTKSLENSILEEFGIVLVSLRCRYSVKLLPAHCTHIHVTRPDTAYTLQHSHPRTAMRGAHTSGRRQLLLRCMSYGGSILNASHVYSKYVDKQPNVYPHTRGCSGQDGHRLDEVSGQKGTPCLRCPQSLSREAHLFRVWYWHVL